MVSADGHARAADFVIVGIGILPNFELAEEAGIATDNGILVDLHARTSDPNILAAGDCASFDHPLLGRRTRLETVHNAVEQGKTIARTLTGHDQAYEQTPWVWSDQYDLRLQSAGDSLDYDAHVVRGHTGKSNFSVFYYRQDRLLGINTVNRPHEFAAVRRMLNEGILLDMEQAADASLDLTRLLPRRVRLRFDEPWPSRRARAAA